MTGSDAPRRLPTLAKINLAALAVVAGALVVHLWPEWTHDPDLSHGLLMPVACVMLIHLSRAPGFGDGLRDRTAAVLATLLGAAALAVLWVAGLLAATVDWDSQIVDFALASSLALLGCGAVAAFAGRSTARVPFNWTSLSAALLWPLCAPFPPGFYMRLTLGLQLWVSGSVMRTLDLLGIAARRQGNIIELARGTVGIEEACSGVRSLISCVFAGLLFSAALTRRPWARVLVVVLSAPIALAMNFLRSLLLTLLVNAGVRVEGPWHDVTGYAVLLATAAILLWLAVALDRLGSPRTSGAEPKRVPEPAAGIPRAQAALGAALALAVATLGFFVANTAAPTRATGPVPDLQAMFPSAVDGWHVEGLPDIYRFAGTLRTDHLVQRTYFRNGEGGSRQITLYLAFWPVGQASVGLVGSHTPDACWPGAGWVAKEVPDTRVALEIAGRSLPDAQHRLFMAEGYPQNVWFWQLDDGHVIDVGDTHSVPALIRIALRYGFRKGGQQAFIRISSNQPWEQVSQEPLVKEFFEHVRGLGLY